jgi:pilus assembly protein CpaC
VFFGSHGDRENETEGAVFIIPSVVTTVPMHAAEFVNATLAHFEEFNGDIGTVNTYPKTPTIVEKGEGGSGKK